MLRGYTAVQRSLVVTCDRPAPIHTTLVSARCPHTLRVHHHRNCSHPCDPAPHPPSVRHSCEHMGGGSSDTYPCSSLNVPHTGGGSPDGALHKCGGAGQQPTPMHQRHTAVVSLRCLYDLRGTTACLCTGVRGGCTRGGGGEAVKCTAHPHRGPTLTVSHILHRT